MNPMHASIWRFTGDPERLARAYDAFTAELGTGQLLVHVCLTAEDGLIVVDTCADRDAWERFIANRAGIVAAMAQQRDDPPPTPGTVSGAMDQQEAAHGSF